MNVLSVERKRGRANEEKCHKKIIIKILRGKQKKNDEKWHLNAHKTQIIHIAMFFLVLAYKWKCVCSVLKEIHKQLKTMLCIMLKPEKRHIKHTFEHGSNKCLTLQLHNWTTYTIFYPYPVWKRNEIKNKREVRSFGFKILYSVNVNKWSNKMWSTKQFNH